MSEYILLILTIIFFTVSSVFLPKLRTFFVFIIIFLFFILSGFRGEVGADTVSYAEIYQRYIAENYSIFEFRFEPIFVFIMKIASLISNDYQVLFIIYALLQSVLLYFIVRKMKSPFLFLTVYSLVFFLQFHMNVIRVGLSALIFLYSMQCQRKDKSFIFLALAVFSHFSIIFIIPLWLIYKKMLTVKVFVVFMLSITLFLLIFYDYFTIKVALYFLESERNIALDGLALMLFLSAPLYFFVVSIFRMKFSLVLFVSCLFLIFTIIGIKYVDIFYRIYFLYCFFTLFLVFDERIILKNSFSPSAPFKFIFCISLIVPSLYSLMNEQEHVKNTNGESSIEYRYTFIPFNFYWNK